MRSPALCSARRCGSVHPLRRPSEAARSASRRLEVAALLEEIKAAKPTRSDVVLAVKRASGGHLDEEGVDRIAAHVMALYDAA